MDEIRRRFVRELADLPAAPWRRCPPSRGQRARRAIVAAWRQLRASWPLGQHDSRDGRRCGHSGTSGHVPSSDRKVVAANGGTRPSFTRSNEGVTHAIPMNAFTVHEVSAVDGQLKLGLTRY